MISQAGSSPDESRKIGESTKGVSDATTPGATQLVVIVFVLLSDGFHLRRVFHLAKIHCGEVELLA